MLIFGRKRVLNLPWYDIQAKIDAKVRKANLQCIHYDFKVRDKVLIKTDGTTKNKETPVMGPLDITQVYVNGTVCIQCGLVSEHLNICHLVPFFESEDTTED